MDYLKLNVFNTLTIWLMVIVLFLFIGVLHSAFMAYTGGITGTTSTG